LGHVAGSTSLKFLSIRDALKAIMKKSIGIIVRIQTSVVTLNHRTSREDRLQVQFCESGATSPKVELGQVKPTTGEGLPPFLDFLPRNEQKGSVPLADARSASLLVNNLYTLNSKRASSSTVALLPTLPGGGRRS
jgi:hypothetical protein